jgi:predicted transcriptional regulator YdeE
MEKTVFENDVHVFGKTVTTFPLGIGDAFDELIKATGDSATERNYYGLSYVAGDGNILYKAVAQEKYTGEAEKLNYETSTIEQGEYVFEVLKDWKNCTGEIKNIFQQMMNDEHTDKTKPCIEWYKSDDEMLCLMKTKQLSNI